jgi:hypothetical protein
MYCGDRKRGEIENETGRVQGTREQLARRAKAFGLGPTQLNTNTGVNAYEK